MFQPFHEPYPSKQLWQQPGLPSGAGDADTLGLSSAASSCRTTKTKVWIYILVEIKLYGWRGLVIPLCQQFLIRVNICCKLVQVIHVLLGLGRWDAAMAGVRFHRSWLAVRQWGAHLSCILWDTVTEQFLSSAKCYRDRIIEISLTEVSDNLTNNIWWLRHKHSASFRLIGTIVINNMTILQYWQDVLYFIQGLNSDLGHIICQTFTRFMATFECLKCILHCQDYSCKCAASLTPLVVTIWACVASSLSSRP